jgi:eukaryotic-like serine/threonine-protein kinase
MIVAGNQRVIASRYELTSPVGSEAAGTVWRAWDMLLDGEVVVREIGRFAAGEALTSEDAYPRMLRGVRAAARITHPGVAAVCDVVCETGRAYMVTEFIEGRPLARVIDDEGLLAPSWAADIGLHRDRARDPGGSRTPAQRRSATSADA